MVGTFQSYYGVVLHGHRKVPWHSMVASASLALTFDIDIGTLSSYGYVVMLYLVCLAHIMLASKAMHHPHQLWQGRVQLQGSDDELHRQEVPREVQAISNLTQNPYLPVMYVYGLWLCAFVGVVKFVDSSNRTLHMGWPSVLVPGVLTVLPFCPPVFLHHTYLDAFIWICTHTHVHTSRIMAHMCNVSMFGLMCSCLEGQGGRDSDIMHYAHVAVGQVPEELRVHQDPHERPAQERHVGRCEDHAASTGEVV